MIDEFVRNYRKAHKPKFSPGLRALIFWMYNGKCAYCLTELPTNFHIDHIKAYSKGGKSTINNLCASCEWCNKIKSTQDWSHKYTPPPTYKLIKAYIEYAMDHFQLEHLL